MIRNGGDERRKELIHQVVLIKRGSERQTIEVFSIKTTAMESSKLVKHRKVEQMNGQRNLFKVN
jgi:hypothetical protein